MTKRTLKRLAMALRKACGSPLLLARGDAVILGYHRVVDDESTQQPGSIAISSRDFASQLTELKKRFTLVQLDELLSMSVEDRKSGGPYCAITFDDGWHDNYTVALPILKSFNIPATIFICTNFIDTNRRYWWEALEECLQCYSKLSCNEKIETRNTLLEVIEDIPGIEKITRDTLIPWCKRQPREKIEEFVKVFSSTLNISTQKQSALSSTEIREMQRNGCIFGSHTANHVILPVETEDIVRDELASSMRYLRTITAQNNILFAYPNGAYSPRDIALVAEAGFSASVTVRPGIVPAQIMRRHELPRIDSCGKNSTASLMFAVFRCSIQRHIKKSLNICHRCVL